MILTTGAIMADSRDISLQILQNVLEGKNFAGVSHFSIAKEDDNAFITMLVLTSLRHLVYIRKILKSLIAKKLSQQNIISQCALILGATELLYMQTPDYAVINSYVNLVKAKTDRYVAGFVNAVLRKITRSKEDFIKGDNGEFFPQNFRTLLRRSYSAKTIAALEKAALIEPQLDITCTDAASAAALNGQTLPLGTIRLAARGKITSLPGYRKGTWWVQDFSSSLAVKMLDSLSGKKVLELCAAPGGKTAQLLTAGSKVTCLDVSEDRLKTLNENLNRLNLKPEAVICGDGISFLKQNTQKFDVIILDAPCSATGTLRRHPEVVHLKTADDITRQAALQKQFLNNVDFALAPGGRLLYCTCSLFREEGEEQIGDFLKNNPAYRIINLSGKIPALLSAIVSPEGFIRILPHHLAASGGADGFFIACLQKVS